MSIQAMQANCIADLLQTRPIVRSSNFILHFKQIAGSGSRHNACELGMIVPKRYIKRAIDRNRIKRQIRTVARTQMNTLVFGLEQQQQTISLLIRLQRQPLWLKASAKDFRHNCRAEMERLFQQLANHMGNMQLKPAQQHDQARVSGQFDISK